MKTKTKTKTKREAFQVATPTFFQLLLLGHALLLILNCCSPCWLRFCQLFPLFPTVAFPLSLALLASASVCVTRFEPLSLALASKRLLEQWNWHEHLHFTSAQLILFFLYFFLPFLYFCLGFGFLFGAAANAAECLSAICHPPHRQLTFCSAFKVQDNESFSAKSWREVEVNCNGIQVDIDVYLPFIGTNSISEEVRCL